VAHPPSLVLPPARRVAVFAPHPDDFDVIAVTLRRLRDAGADIQLAVMTTGASGVDNADFPGLDRQARARLRETEQERSCVYFGLPPGTARFLRLDVRPELELIDDDATRAAVRTVLTEWQPELVFLPHPDDPNAAHQRTFAIVSACLREVSASATMLLNRDPKTRAMTPDLHVVFDEAEAGWKRNLLRHHESQQRRNLRTRGRGLDDRILDLNRSAAAETGRAGYAEVFETRRIS
jgi:LmbE family N-acetylglucosaminyl deacetylase